jgi:hypothetical protein
MGSGSIELTVVVRLKVYTLAINDLDEPIPVELIGLEAFKQSYLHLK